MDPAPSPKNIIFISYNHKDMKWAKWIQKRLEWYRLPKEVRNRFPSSKYIRPVFRDRDCLSSGILNEKIRRNLESSEYLVVICSPNSAQSKWVSDEVEYFIHHGRIDKIIPFIVKGSPKDYTHLDTSLPKDDECFPSSLRQWNKDHPDKNPLAIAVVDDGKSNRQKAFIRLVAYILGIDFRSLWNRHRRFLHRIIATTAALATLMAFISYWLMVPVRICFAIQDERCSLPGMEQCILNVNGSDYSFNNPDTTIEARSLPGYYRLRTIPISLHADRFYFDESFPLTVGFGIRQDAIIQLHRDSTFSTFSGKVYDGGFEDFEAHPVVDAKVTIGSHHTMTDHNGYFRIVLPLEEQSEFKAIAISKKGYTVYQRDDESPSDDLTYLIHRE